MRVYHFSQWPCDLRLKVGAHLNFSINLFLLIIYEIKSGFQYNNITTCNIILLIVKIEERLKAATQRPVARPRRQPMSSNAPSGGALSPRMSSSLPT